MYATLGQLSIVPLERVILHEAHDPDRLATLSERVAAEGIQRNPVILSSYDEDFLLLDGAHRAHTVSDLGCKFVLAQVIDLPRTTESWTHLLANPSLNLLSGNEAFDVSGDSSADWLASVETVTDTYYLRPREAGLPAEVQALWALRNTYPPREPVQRLDSQSSSKITDAEARFRYRAFAVEELVEVVRTGGLLPAGITRFRVSERILGVRFPLSGLMDGDLAARQSELEDLVARQWNANRIRRYDEPVVLFE